jgi:hypothetical protein
MTMPLDILSLKQYKYYFNILNIIIQWIYFKKMLLKSTYVSDQIIVIIFTFYIKTALHTTLDKYRYLLTAWVQWL